MVQGGAVIASGGFGCVFVPPLKCNGQHRIPNNVSKLMNKTDALQEYREIQVIRSKLQKIPKFSNYFMLENVDICEIEKLSETDLVAFDKKCKPLTKDGINKSNINDKLNLLLSLNLPHGGLTVDSFLYKHLSHRTIEKFNDGLINLLKYGILPMNGTNTYHSDIKDSNILIDDRNNCFRLIDWGLSVITESNTEIPKLWKNRPFQFNVPFSNVLMSDFFIDKFDEFLHSNDCSDDISLRSFVTNFIHTWLDKRGPGHYKYINMIMYMLFRGKLDYTESETQKNQIIESEFTMRFISNYLTEILQTFSRNDKTAKEIVTTYMNDVFKRNVDVWGLVISYIPILEILFENEKSLSHKETALFAHIRNIFVNNLFLNADKPIDTNKLIVQLKHINQFLHHYNGKKLKYVQNSIRLHSKRIKKTNIELKSSKRRRGVIQKTLKAINKKLLFSN
tara:strand:- start:1096 stop:2445 length:1350 start_codon:yes stop_codon:yes gene_type:complete